MSLGLSFFIYKVRRSDQVISKVPHKNSDSKPSIKKEKPTSLTYLSRSINASIIGISDTKGSPN